MNKDIEKNDKNQEKKQREPLAISVSALLREEFPEPKWIVQDILPEGSLSILTARPKAGKTFLALQLAVSVTLGRLFVMKKTEKVPVLFLSYELNRRQMKKRISLLLEHLGISVEEAKEMGGKRFPFFLSFASRLKGVQGLLCLLKAFEKKGMKVGLVFIDTYILFRDLGEQARKEGKTAYELESEYLATLRKLCEEEKIAIILIYHNRKKQATSGDITEEVMGSTGITGAVNNLLFLDRKTGSKEAHLRITGHDIEEHDIELTFERGWFRLRTANDKEQEIAELVISYLKQVGQANQSSITSYLKSKGYKSVHEVKDVLDKYSQENSDTPVYWYVFRKKREGGGNPLKIFSLTPPPNFKQEMLIEEKQKKDDPQERVNFLKRVEALLYEGVISPDEFPEKLEDYGVHDFKTFTDKVSVIPINILREYVEKLEAYRSQAEEWNFEINDEDYEFDF
jgi:RecA-family ATPase